MAELLDLSTARPKAMLQENITEHMEFVSRDDWVRNAGLFMTVLSFYRENN
jgi:hypothetical protein